LTAPVRIREIAAGGDGVGTLEDGRTVFVPRTAPGDLVALAELRLHKRFARARVGLILEPGPDRVEPRCEHYVADNCGGCQLQHLTGEAQRHARSAIVGAAIRRLGRREVPDPEVEPAPADWGYRTRITLAVQGGGRRIGFHRHGQAGDVFDLRRCEIAAPELQRLWSGLRELRSLLPPDLTHLGLRIDRSGGLHVLLEPAEQTAWNGAERLHAEVVRKGFTVSIWWQPPGGAPRTLAGATEAFPATVFEQMHPVMGDRVRAWAISQLGDIAGKHAWDLYAGIGETTSALAAGGATVESVESDRRAVALAEQRGPAVGITRHVGTVEGEIRRLRPPHFLITNPPRTGMDERATAAIAAAAPARIAYLSCDPATLARDLTRLGDDYRISALRAFDLFPQTAHVETVTLLERT
jgi:23S rRNA (uracil1939-C5)-methyltransferase